MRGRSVEADYCVPRLQGTSQSRADVAGRAGNDYERPGWHTLRTPACVTRLRHYGSTTLRSICSTHQPLIERPSELEHGRVATNQERTRLLRARSCAAYRLPVLGFSVPLRALPRVRRRALSTSEVHSLIVPQVQIGTRPMASRIPAVTRISPIPKTRGADRGKRSNQVTSALRTRQPDADSTARARRHLGIRP